VYAIAGEIRATGAPQVRQADTPTADGEQGDFFAHPEEVSMYEGDRNEYGCPLQNQRGSEGVRDFYAIIAQLSPTLQAAFEAEQRVRWSELEWFRATCTFPTAASMPDRAASVEQAPAALGQSPWLERLLQRAGQSIISKRNALHIF